MLAPDFGYTLDSRRFPFRPAQVLTGDIFAHPEFLSAPIQGGESHHTRPILKIQDGCNNRCSFCVIPYVRGKSRSLAPNEVIHEIQKLSAQHPLPPANPKVEQPILAVSSPTSHACEIPVAQALLTVPLSSFTSSASCTSSISPAREIVLSGINLGTYGRDLTPRVEFIDLVRRILSETQIERLRISSIEPQDVTQDLIDLFAQTDRIAQHFHMPLQSASNRILAAMHRWYRSEHYARRIDIIHDRLPNAALGADVIAGFPGETESDHAATARFHRPPPLHLPPRLLLLPPPRHQSRHASPSNSRRHDQTPSPRTPRLSRPKVRRIPPHTNRPHHPRPNSPPRRPFHQRTNRRRIHPRPLLELPPRPSSTNPPVK